MLVRASDDRPSEIEELQELADRSDVDRLRRAEIDQQLLALRADAHSRADAAAEIELRFGRDPDVATIHDLRIEARGRAARLDHLILDRFGRIWIADSAYFDEGIAANERGEWSRWRSGRRERIASPAVAARDRAHVLRALFDAGLVAHPERFGRVTLRPEIRTVVLLSDTARLTRPSTRVEGFDQVVRLGRFARTVAGGLIDASPIRLARLSEEALHGLGVELAGLHRPERTDWARRFGLAPSLAPRENDVPDDARSDDERASTEASADRVARWTEERYDRAIHPVAPAVPFDESRHRCASCDGPVSWAAVKFCWNQPARFGRKVYCMQCRLRLAPA
jgi:hypothetical protein